MKLSISENFKDACNSGNLDEVNYIYQHYLTVPETKCLKPIDYSILNENIDLLLSIFQATCPLDIMEWIYHKLDLYLNKDLDMINISHNDIYHFWIETFKNACYYGNTDLVKWLFEKAQQQIFGYYNMTKTGDTLAKQCLHEDDCNSFRSACSQGHVKTAELLYDLGFTMGYPLNLHTNNQWCFYWGCQSGKLEMVKWLYHKSYSSAQPFTNLVDMYHLLKEDESSLGDDKLEVLYWLSELRELEGIATDWTLVDDDDFPEIKK